jgi:hypothetical protein
VELSVRPDDLAAAASALRRSHAALAQASAEFVATALRLVPQLGAHAAASAESTLSAADHGAELVEADIATFADGLTAVATYYAALDSHALGRLTVRR